MQTRIVGLSHFKRCYFEADRYGAQKLSVSVDVVCCCAARNAGREGGAARIGFGELGNCEIETDYQFSSLAFLI